MTSHESELFTRLTRQVRLLQFLVLGIVTALAVAATLGFARPSGSTGTQIEKFDEITVGRINVVEPDGTLRLVVSSRGRFPGDFFQGVESPRPDRKHAAGMLFLNDEGTECGGLIYAGKKDDAAGVSSGMSLTFDRFRQDQVLQLLHQEEGSFASTGLSINDRPDGSKYSIPDMKRDFAEIEKLPADQQQARYAAHQAEGKLGNPRAFLGTTRDQGSALMLSDAAGRPRLLMMVGADGEPTLQVLDEQGKVKGVFALTPASSSK